MISVLCEVNPSLYQDPLDEGLKEKWIEDTVYHKKKGKMSLGHAFKGAVGGMVAKATGIGKDLDDAKMKDRQLKAEMVKKLRNEKRRRAQETKNDRARRKSGKVVRNRPAYA